MGNKILMSAFTRTTIDNALNNTSCVRYVNYQDMWGDYTLMEQIEGIGLDKRSIHEYLINNFACNPVNYQYVDHYATCFIDDDWSLVKDHTVNSKIDNHIYIPLLESDDTPCFIHAKYDQVFEETTALYFVDTLNKVQHESWDMAHIVDPTQDIQNDDTVISEIIYDMTVFRKNYVHTLDLEGNDSSDGLIATSYRENFKFHVEFHIWGQKNAFNVSLSRPMLYLILGATLFAISFTVGVVVSFVLYLIFKFLRYLFCCCFRKKKANKILVTKQEKQWEEKKDQKEIKKNRDSLSTSSSSVLAPIDIESKTISISIESIDL